VAEVNAERVHPEPVRIFGIAHRNVARDALVISETREQPESARQTLLAVTAFFGDGCKHRLRRQIFRPAGDFSSNHQPSVYQFDAELNALAYPGVASLRGYRGSSRSETRRQTEL